MGSVGTVTSCVSGDDRLKGIERRGGALQDFRGAGAWPERFLIGRCWLILFAVISGDRSLPGPGHLATFF